LPHEPETWIEKTYLAEDFGNNVTRVAIKTRDKKIQIEKVSPKLLPHIKTK